ncbi:hypothetical protein Tco_0026912 [Tanacetum coccineum]
MEDQSITKEKERRERSKPKGKRSRHQETSSDFEREEGSEDAYEDLNSPYKRPKPTPFTQRITCFKYHMRAKLPQNIRVYEGNKDPEDHLGIFSAAAKQKEWLMPVWCKMFCQTLGGAARKWFDDLDPKSVDSFKELSKKFSEEFHNNRELAKKINDKIPKMMDEMFERVRAFIRGEVVAGSAEMLCHSQGNKGYIRLAWIGGPEISRNRGGLREVQRNMGVYTPYSRKDTFTPLNKTPKEILAMESGSQHQRMLSVKKANRGSCGLEEVGSSGEGHSPEQLAEWESGKERCKDHKHDKGRRKSQEAF